MPEEQSPKVFISYSWDDNNHRKWVRDFATRLREDGVDAILDLWEAVPGDQLTTFMEKAVKTSDFVLCVCTPNYKNKSDQRMGGVGYEGDIMTGEVFIHQNQRKFIPILRKGKWKEAAPSWLIGKYYIDLRGNPLSDDNYKDLLKTLHDEREDAPPIRNFHEQSSSSENDSEFVNREIELATFDPPKLWESYWQYALVNSPTGYGKTRLLKRLKRKIYNNLEIEEKWNCCYLDLKECNDHDDMSSFIVKAITGKSFTSDYTEMDTRNQLCAYILEKMCAPSKNGSLRGVLIIVDSIDCLTSTSIDWFSALMHSVIVGSYIDYELGKHSFPVRFILSGVNTQSFYENYLSWEESFEVKYKLLSPRTLTLSAFDKLAIQDLVSRRSKKAKISLGPLQIIDLSLELQYLSGGHPQVVSEILDELIEKNFRLYKDYLRSNRSRLISNYISKVSRKILKVYPMSQAQRDIKTICVFRLIDINTLRRLLVDNLISSQIDINTLGSFLGSLCENKVLNPPSKDNPFYHDDIIRRILYLDLAFRNEDDTAHVQKVHNCAKSLYFEWISENQEQHSIHYFFVEWLFHSLQITDLSKDDILVEWISLFSSIQPTSITLTDLKRMIKEKINNDSEIIYLYLERFKTEDRSVFFEF